MLAMERFGSKEANDQFSKLTAQLWTRIVPREGWMNFFCSAVYGMAADKDGCLAAFHEPWADVVLMTLWEKAADRWQVTDIDLLLGDFIRRQGSPPFNAMPGWSLLNSEPAQAVALSTQVTLNSFAQTFAPDKNGKTPSLRHWRASYPNAQRAEIMEENLAGAREAFERKTLALLDFLHHKAFPAAVSAVLTDLQQDRLYKVLNSAPATSRETGELLRRHMAGQWGKLHLACWARGTGNDSFLIFDTHPPDSFVSFKFKAEPGKAPWLDRIDFVNHRAYGGFLRSTGLKDEAAPGTH